MTLSRSCAQRYRKRPIEVEAMRWDGTNMRELERWAGFPYAKVSPAPASVPNNAIRVYTLEGILWADEGTWIVKGLKGEFYPVRPDIFEETYEAVTDLKGKETPSGK